jgi:hypothetical protein
MADVTEEEEHRDQLYVTEQPVEIGAAINDHAYKRPAEVQMRIAWSNSSHFDPFYVQSMYGKLLALQADRIPFNLYTGKRMYANMLFSMLVVRTDSTSEYALRVDATLSQVFLVQQSKSSSISNNPNNLADPSTQLPTQNNGNAVLQTPTNLNQNGALFQSSNPAAPAALAGTPTSSIGQIPLLGSSFGTGVYTPGNIAPLSSVQ